MSACSGPDLDYAMECADPRSAAELVGWMQRLDVCPAGPTGSLDKGLSQCVMSLGKSLSR